MRQKYVYVIWWLLAFTAGVICGSALVSDESSSHESTFELHTTVIIVSLGAIVCTVLVVFGCACLCPTQTPEFKDFDNDGFFQDVTIEPPTTNFAMIPPAVDSNDGVHFDPLPNVTDLRQRQQSLSTPSSPTVIELRPRVSQIGHERVESDDEGEVQTQEAVALQERVKLEKLLLMIHKVSARHKVVRNQLQYIREMGTSWFGKVLLAEGQDIQPGHKKSRVVIQMLHENADQHMQYIFLQESAPYREMDHVNVLKMLGHCIEAAPFLTLLELCPLGDLKTYLRSRRSDHDAIDKQGLLLNMACDMASGLQAMHHNNFVHRDFAIRNCLVSTDLSIKVGDYGLAEEMFKEDYYFASNGDGIPIRWLAPEVVDTSEGCVTLRHITKDCNLWSFGISLWELVTFGALPYGDLNNDQVIRQVIIDNSVRLCQPEVPVSNLERLYQLMSLCWHSPAQRPSLRELRIMLLHLRSSRDDLDPSASAEFDRKWNQLMPRSAAGHIPSVMTPVSLDSDEDDADMNFNMSHIRQKPTSVVHEARMSMLPTVHSASGLPPNLLPASVLAARPASFDSEFGGSEQNASLLAQAGSLQASLRSLSTSPSNTPDDDVTVGGPTPRFSFPANELSLASELGTLNALPKVAFEMVEYDSDGEPEISVDMKPDEMISLHSTAPSNSLITTGNPTNVMVVEANIESPNVFDEEEWHGFTEAPPSMVQSHCEVHVTKLPTDTSEAAGKELTVAAKSEYENSAGHTADERPNGNGMPDIATVHAEPIDESFVDIGTPPSVSDNSPAKSCDLESPVKSTTSSADWFLVSNTSEHSKEEEFDRTSRVTEHSLPSDCVLVTEKMTEGSNDDIATATTPVVGNNVNSVERLPSTDCDVSNNASATDQVTDTEVSIQ